MAVHVDTAQYEWSHGRAPRGHGHWAFAPSRCPEFEAVVFAPPGTYSQAKRWAQKWARGQGHAVVYVQP